LNCLVLIIVVLLQSGKAADLAGAFGGAGSQTAFGPRGAANVLSKATTWCAIMFHALRHGVGASERQGGRTGQLDPAKSLAACAEAGPGHSANHARDHSCDNSRRAAGRSQPASQTPASSQPTTQPAPANLAARPGPPKKP